MHAGRKPYSFAVCRDDRGVDLHVVSLLFVLSYLVESVWVALIGVKFGQFLAFYKALTIKTLRKTKQITAYNHAEKPHNLRQISLQTASNDHVF